MLEDANEKRIKKDKDYWKTRQNLFGFFQLLLEVDKRIDPEFYENHNKKNSEKDGR